MSYQQRKPPREKQEDPWPFPKHHNSAISQQTHKTVNIYRGKSHEAITSRLKELAKEWELEKAMMLYGSGASMFALLLSRWHSEMWLSFTALVLIFFLQFAFQGWCPLVPLLRMLGFRSSVEIHGERQALRIARGDYDSLTYKERPSENEPEPKIQNQQAF